jgi:hypothetical protein
MERIKYTTIEVILRQDQRSKRDEFQLSDADYYGSSTGHRKTNDAWEVDRLSSQFEAS